MTRRQCCCRCRSHSCCGGCWRNVVAAAAAVAGSISRSICAKKVLEAIDLMLQPVVYLVCIYIKHAAHTYTHTYSQAQAHA